MTWLALVVGLGTAALAAIPGLTIAWIFAIDLGLGVISSLRGGVRFGLLNEILPPGGYLLGRSVLNMSDRLMQICGYAAGGVLVTVLSPRGTLLVGAGFGLIVGCESLFVAYSPQHAGTLFACAAVGMLAGDTLAGRFVPQHWRDRLSPWLRLLLAGHALGLQSSGTLAMQGVGAALVGLVAEQTGPGTAMAVIAAISVTVTLLLAPGLRSGARTTPVPSTAPGT